MAVGIFHNDFYGQLGANESLLFLTP